MRPDYNRQNKYNNYRNRYQNNHSHEEESDYVYTRAEVEKNCILCDRINFDYKKYEVYKAYVAFTEDTNKFKSRPVVVLKDKGDTVICLKCTSKKYPHDGYYDKCPVDDWRFAGFSKQSYMVLKTTVEINKRYIFKRLGKLNSKDIDKLQEVGL